MRLRRLCLAIFALRLFLREPISFSDLRSRSNHLIRHVATPFFAVAKIGLLSAPDARALVHQGKVEGNRLCFDVENTVPVLERALIVT